MKLFVVSLLTVFFTLQSAKATQFHSCTDIFSRPRLFSNWFETPTMGKVYKVPGKASRFSIKKHFPELYDHLIIGFYFGHVYLSYKGYRLDPKGTMITGRIKPHLKSLKEQNFLSAGLAFALELSKKEQAHLDEVFFQMATNGEPVDLIENHKLTCVRVVCDILSFTELTNWRFQHWEPWSLATELFYLNRLFAEAFADQESPIKALSLGTHMGEQLEYYQLRMVFEKAPSRLQIMIKNLLGKSRP